MLLAVARWLKGPNLTLSGFDKINFYSCLSFSQTGTLIKSIETSGLGYFDQISETSGATHILNHSHYSNFSSAIFVNGFYIVLGVLWSKIESTVLSHFKTLKWITLCYRFEHLKCRNNNKVTCPRSLTPLTLCRVFNHPYFSSLPHQIKIQSTSYYKGFYTNAATAVLRLPLIQWAVHVCAYARLD